VRARAPPEDPHRPGEVGPEGAARRGRRVRPASVADGVVVPCADGAEPLAPFAAHAREGTVVAANLTVVAGLGGSPATLAADARRAAALGATELRLYHAGLASDQDLAHVRTALSRLA
ncbi:hypothetical protein AB0I84_39875, partial [Streptomyces spectabilis]